MVIWRAVKKTIDEKCIIKMVLELLLGYSSLIFQKIEKSHNIDFLENCYFCDDNVFTISSFGMSIECSHISSHCLQEILIEFVKYGNSVNFLRTFIRKIALNRSPRTLEGFTATLNEILRNFLKQIAELEENLEDTNESFRPITLLLLYDKLNDWFSRIKWIEDVVKQAFPPCSSLKYIPIQVDLFLFVLYTIIEKSALLPNGIKAINANCPCEYNIGMNLFFGALIPYLEILDSWIYDGDLIDYYNEVFLNRDQDNISYVVNKKRVPYFLLEAEDLILRSGEVIRIIKDLKKKGFLESNREKLSYLFKKRLIDVFKREMILRNNIANYKTEKEILPEAEEITLITKFNSEEEKLNENETTTEIVKQTIIETEREKVSSQVVNLHKEIRKDKEISSLLETEIKIVKEKEMNTEYESKEQLQDKETLQDKDTLCDNMLRASEELELIEGKRIDTSEELTDIVKDKEKKISSKLLFREEQLLDTIKQISEKEVLNFEEDLNKEVKKLELEVNQENSLILQDKNVKVKSINRNTKRDKEGNYSTNSLAIQTESYAKLQDDIKKENQSIDDEFTRVILNVFTKDSIHLPPPSILIKRNLLNAAKLLLSHADNLLVDVFRKKLQVLMVCSILRSIFLMEEEDLLHHFTEVLFSKLNCDDSSWLNSEALSALLISSIQRGTRRKVTLEVYQDFSISLETTQPNLLPSNIHSLEVLKFVYVPRWPLCLILSQESLNYYNKIAIFLLQIKRVKSNVVQFKHSIRHRTLFRDETLQAKNRQLLLSLSHMLHFIDNLHHYLLNQSVHFSWKKLVNEFELAENIEIMEKCHREYLSMIFDKCFLTEKSREILETIHQMLNCILDFVKEFDMMLYKIEEKKNQMESIHQINKNGENWKTETIEEKCSKLAHNFWINHKDFICLLTTRIRCDSSNHLQEILMVLNFNDFVKELPNTL